MSGLAFVILVLVEGVELVSWVCSFGLHRRANYWQVSCVHLPSATKPNLCGH